MRVVARTKLAGVHLASTILGLPWQWVPRRIRTPGHGRRPEASIWLGKQVAYCDEIVVLCAERAISQMKVGWHARTPG